MNHLSNKMVRHLLGRSEHLPPSDAPAITRLADSSVLVTGAGTLGTAICEHLTGCVRELHCCDHSEVALYSLAREVVGVQGHLCSVVSYPQVCDLMAKTRPDVVIHTAAHKHVGLIEAVPRAGVQNNIGGLVVLAQAALTRGCRFLLISSDKAVSPSCAYGATKHVCERLTYGWSASVLRLVNLLGSSGSVLPTFRERALRGLPLFVTHPEVERHFITVREAALAAIEAASLAPAVSLATTETFPPVRIADLAERVGSWLGKTVEVEFTNLSPVEKLTEQPLYPDEVMGFTGGLLVCGSPHPRSLNTNDSAYHNLMEVVEAGGRRREVRVALQALVPDYTGVEQ